MTGAWLPPRASEARRARAGGRWIPLVRRGVHHGWVRATPARRPASADAVERWRRAEPLHLPGLLRAGLAARRAEVRSSLRLFERLRGGASFQDAVWRRLARHPELEPAGTTVDLGDAREIEKVFADARRGGRPAARDLWAKLSWIAVDARDPSLRVRFSFGAEQLLDWQGETRRAPWADRLAEAVFPECDVLAGNAALARLVERCAGRRVRFSERIVYSNAPGGGAVFHHDVEPHQLGVAYGQLAGATAWLALPKRGLAQEVAAWSGASARAALRRLDRQGDAELLRLLNHTPRFTQRLVERGALVLLRAGDALLLPSPGPDDVAWHSVFALGERPSLAHSYGIFPRRR